MQSEVEAFISGHVMKGNVAAPLPATDAESAAAAAAAAVKGLNAAKESDASGEELRGSVDGKVALEEAREGKPATNGDAPTARRSSESKVAARVLAGDAAALSLDSDNPGSFLFLQAMRVSCRPWMIHLVHACSQRRALSTGKVQY